MARRKKVEPVLDGKFIPGEEGLTDTKNYQQVLAEYNQNSQLVSFIAPDGTPYFISGQAGVNQLIAGQNVTLTPPSGQGNVRIDVMEAGTVQSVAARWQDGAPTQPIVVSGSPITTSGVLQFDYGSGQFPANVLGTNATGETDRFLNSAGSFTPVIGTAIPYVRFNASAVGGAGQQFTNPIFQVYGGDATKMTVFANGVQLSPPTVSPANSGSYTLAGNTITVSDYLDPNAVIEVMSKAVIAGGAFVGTVRSVNATVPTGLSVSGGPITDTGTLNIVWNTGIAYIPQSSLGSGTTGINTVLTGGASNAIWQAISGAVVSTNATQTLTNKTLTAPSISGLTTPMTADQPATKGYVDASTTGFVIKSNCQYASTDNLTGAWTYNNALGTLTGPINQALSVDGYTFTAPDIGTRILVKNEGSEAVISATIVNAGTDYTVGTVLTVAGGTPVGGLLANRATFTVASVGEQGVISTLTLLNAGNYSILPPNPVSVTSSVGSGATLNLTFGNTSVANGIYTLTSIQTVSAGVVLTRAVDMNAWDEVYRALININAGTANGGTTWIADVPQSGTLGTTGINFTQFGGSGAIVGVNKGGTGVSNLPSGNLLIGNGLNPILTNANLFWDNVNARLGIGTTTPVAGIDVRKGIRLQQGYEAETVITTALTGTQSFDISTGAIWFYTINATGNFTFDFTATGGNINTRLPIGHSLTVCVKTTQGSTAYFLSSNPTIDGTATGVTTRWQGVARPTFGNVNSIDAYTFHITKTASATYTVLATRAQFGGV